MGAADYLAWSLLAALGATGSAQLFMAAERHGALAQAWLFLVAAELIASSSGLGFLLVDSQNNGRVDRILLAIVLLALIGKASDSVLGLFERWAVRRWT